MKNFLSPWKELVLQQRDQRISPQIPAIFSRTGPRSTRISECYGLEYTEDMRHVVLFVLNIREWLSIEIRQWTDDSHTERVRDR